MTGTTAESEAPQDTHLIHLNNQKNSPADAEISESDIAAIQNGLREATGEDVYVNHGESSLYYDATTMAPLNPFSAVSKNKNQKAKSKSLLSPFPCVPFLRLLPFTPFMTR